MLVLIFVFSILLMLLAISFFGIGDVFSTVAGSNLSLVLPAVMLQTAILFLYAFRFKVMSSRYKKNLVQDDTYHIPQFNAIYAIPSYAVVCRNLHIPDNSRK
ncbi:MAG: hypothetical protein QMD97_02925 [Candidatus Aenigmarchaeota archaeon]|nr:hypothetical protein [Candidatus Aenigmarchaeota archaeon]